MSDKPYEDNGLRDAAWAGLLHAHARLVQNMNAELVAAGLLAMDFYDVLLTLKRAPEHRLRMSDLAERVVLSRSGLTRLLDRIEREGFLARETAKEDRRGAYAVLLKAGDMMLFRTWLTYQRLIEEHFGKHISDKEADTLRSVFLRLAPPLPSEPVEITVASKRTKK